MSDSSDNESTAPPRRAHPIFRAKRPVQVSLAAANAKCVRLAVMQADGYTPWQIERAEGLRRTSKASDEECVTQSVFTLPATAAASASTPTMAERVAAMVEPVALIAPTCRKFLPASIPGVTVCRPWADDPAAYPAKNMKQGVQRLSHT